MERKEDESCLMQNVVGSDNLSPVETNYLKFGNRIKTEEKLLQSITCEIRGRITARGRFKKTQENIELCRSWGISENILCCRMVVDAVV